MIDLREQDYNAINTIAKNIFSKGTEIWAYGSRVKGTNHDTSDLDLVVRFPCLSDDALLDKMQSLTQLDDFIEALKESNVPIIVQALAWNSIPDRFRTTISERYEVFLCV